jgi:hypothetical protein
VSARWRIVTAAIMSEWEQGGISIAAAYSTTIIPSSSSPSAAYILSPTACCGKEMSNE